MNEAWFVMIVLGGQENRWPKEGPVLMTSRSMDKAALVTVSKDYAPTPREAVRHALEGMDPDDRARVCNPVRVGTITEIIEIEISA
jgi:hypothetical protein